MSELAEKSKAFYERNLKDFLESTEKGKFVAIEPDTESYFVDKDGTKALFRAREAFPDKLFFLIRIGYEAAHSIGDAGPLTLSGRFPPSSSCGGIDGGDQGASKESRCQAG